MYGDGRQRRDFTYIDDAIAGTIAAGTAHLPNSLINVGAGGTTSLNDVVDQARRIGVRGAVGGSRLRRRRADGGQTAHDRGPEGAGRASQDGGQ
ncbi:NAD-dependent epimerase/dehydratase family protein [Nonomuraea sp. NPDC048826]|uniref:NAD-dependent epimerase/dehydratase family protein n=1 Tax=Nonomuraea sp. NPDC048826 TaxID=3364347 RepID=UPI00371880BF